LPSLLQHAFGQFGHVAGFLAEFAADYPFLATALTPLAEVLFADGNAVEFLFDDFLELFEAVEPGEDLGSGLGAVKAFVQEVADGAGQMGDFTVARVHSFGLVQVSVFHHGHI
jgi:hypothetical protein